MFKTFVLGAWDICLKVEGQGRRLVRPLDSKGLKFIVMFTRASNVALPNTLTFMWESTWDGGQRWNHFFAFTICPKWSGRKFLKLPKTISSLKIFPECPRYSKTSLITKTKIPLPNKGCVTLWPCHLH